MSEIKYCGKCGAEIKPGVKFCGKCGAAVEPDAEPAKTGQTKVQTQETGQPAQTRQARQIDMKRLLIVLLVAAAAVIVVIVAIVAVRHRDKDVDLYEKYGIISGMNFTDSEVEQAAEDMYRALYTTAALGSYEDPTEFSKLIIGGTDEEIAQFQLNYFLSEGGLEEHIITIVVLNEDPYYLVQVIGYLADHNYTIDQVFTLDQKYLMSYTDDGWKINYTPEGIEFVNSHEMLMKRYPEEVVDAIEDGRNVEACPRCYMWLNSYDLFYDVFEEEPLFLWQNEDGSVDVMIWLGNGEDPQVYIGSGQLLVTDAELGTVLDVVLNVDDVLYSGEVKTMTFHIEPEDVLTGTAGWTDLSYEFELEYQPGIYIGF